jgi:hypothetical protein
MRASSERCWPSLLQWLPSAIPIPPLAFWLTGLLCPGFLFLLFLSLCWCFVPVLRVLGSLCRTHTPPPMHVYRMGGPGGPLVPACLMDDEASAITGPAHSQLPLFQGLMRCVCVCVCVCVFVVIRSVSHVGFCEAHAGGARLMAACVQRNATAAMREEHQYRRQENAAAAAAEVARARGFCSLFPLLRLPSLSHALGQGHAHLACILQGQETRRRQRQRQQLSVRLLRRQVSCLSKACCASKMASPSYPRKLVCERVFVRECVRASFLSCVCCVCARACVVKASCPAFCEHFEQSTSWLGLPLFAGVG